MRYPATKTVLLLCLCAALWPATPAQACDIPVHLWALERWEPDPYPVYVFREAGLTPVQQAALDRLEGDAHHANLVVREVDLTSTLDDPTRAIWEAQTDAVLPWVVVRHPVPAPATVKVWAGPLDTAAVDALVDSPKRREVARHLVKGDAVVWILLDGTDASASVLDDALEEVRKNPPTATPTPGAPTSDRASYPLPRFPVVRVSRSDPAERVFVEMLLGVEPDLKGYTEPMAFPVFGRGRALYALVGPGIGPKTVRNACAFLVNGCSCQVKEQNPGMDLLLAVDWSGRPAAPQVADESAPPPLPGVPRPEAAAMPPSAASSGTVLRNLLVMLGLGALTVAGVSAAIWKKRGSAFHG